MPLTKALSRKRWAELRDLVVEWDPLGLVGMGAPRDEYDCLLGRLMRQLELPEPDGAISSYLEHEFVHHFGCSMHPPDVERRQFIHRARAWFSERWQGKHVTKSADPE